MVQKAEKNYSISCCRFIAMCFIISCHVMQQSNIAIVVRESLGAASPGRKNGIVFGRLILKIV